MLNYLIIWIFTIKIILAINCVNLNNNISSINLISQNKLYMVKNIVQTICIYNFYDLLNPRWCIKNLPFYKSTLSIINTGNLVIYNSSDILWKCSDNIINYQGKLRIGCPTTGVSQIEKCIIENKGSLPENTSVTISQKNNIILSYQYTKFQIPQNQGLSDVFFTLINSTAYVLNLSLDILVENTHSLMIPKSGGRSLFFIKDINQDIFDDVIICAPFLSICYILFGTENNIEMTNGFTITGIKNSFLGLALSETDNFLVISAPHLNSLQGAVYLLHKQCRDYDLNFFTSEMGFIIYGREYSVFGSSLSVGKNNILIGSIEQLRSLSGSVTIIYQNISENIYTSNLNETQGKIIYGNKWSNFGVSISELPNEDILIGSFVDQKQQTYLYSKGFLNLISLGGIFVDGSVNIFIGNFDVNTLYNGYSVKIEKTMLTYNPTNYPTKIPTKNPTKNPQTRIPTIQSTSKPSLKPAITNYPTIFYYPSNVPSSIPSNKENFPSSNPSKKEKLSSFPTQNPSKKEILSNFPTINSIKTNNPTLKPSRLLRIHPTQNPTSFPTNLNIKIKEYKPSKIILYASIAVSVTCFLGILWCFKDICFQLKDDKNIKVYIPVLNYQFTVYQDYDSELSDFEISDMSSDIESKSSIDIESGSSIDIKSDSSIDFRKTIIESDSSIDFESDYFNINTESENSIKSDISSIDECKMFDIDSEENKSFKFLLKAINSYSSFSSLSPSYNNIKEKF